MDFDNAGPLERLVWLDRRVRAAPLFVLLLDFDGTLAGIVERPDLVRLDPLVEKTLASLVRRSGVRVAIVSGRPVEELRSLLPVGGLTVAGNHGLEIVGPTIRFLHAEAADRLGQIELLADDLRAELAAIPGALVENKRLSVACHSRAVPPALRPRFWDEVRRVVGRNAGAWRLLAGKWVVEILPALDWTKGSCARLLLDQFESQAGGRPAPFAVAIGDDRTDRDLLAEVLGRGCAIAVGDSLGPGWDLQLRDVPAVHRLLERFDRLRSEPISSEA